MRQALVLIGVGLWLRLMVLAGARSEAREAANVSERAVPRWARVLGARDDFARWQRDGARGLQAMQLGAWVLVSAGILVLMLALVF